MAFLPTDLLGKEICLFVTFYPLYLRDYDTCIGYPEWELWPSPLITSQSPRSCFHVFRKAATWTDSQQSISAAQPSGSQCPGLCKHPSMCPVSELEQRSCAFANEVSFPLEQSGCMLKISWEWSLAQFYPQTMPELIWASVIWRISKTCQGA